MPRRRILCLSLVDRGALLPPVAAAAQAVGLKHLDCPSETGVKEALAHEPVAALVISNLLGPSLVSNLVRGCQRRHPSVPVIILGATATVEEAVEAMRRGASDFVPAPIQGEALRLCLQRLVGHADHHVDAPSVGAPGYLGLVGSSPVQRVLYDAVEKIARFKTNVLLLGESGTGKELIARALHARGPRRTKLFVPINCATLGRDLLENELFGHERGAFTGANERKKGLFELADGGTLFLDEIAEMDLSTQAKLLRVLERNAFRRVGGSEKVRVDLSVIAATNKNLHEAIAAGRFREDLYYRLKVVHLVMPPLRERREDIPALIEHFIDDFNRRHDRKIKGVAPIALKRLMDHDWPGNVRELKNAIESAAVLSSSETLGPEALDEFLARPGPASRAVVTPPSSELRIPFGLSLAEIEKMVIGLYLDHYRTKSGAARALGLGLRTLYTKLKGYERAFRADATLKRRHIVPK